MKRRKIKKCVDMMMCTGSDTSEMHGKRREGTHYCRASQLLAAGVMMLTDITDVSPPSHPPTEIKSASQMTCESQF